MNSSTLCLLCAVLIIATGFAEAQKEVILYNIGNNFYYQGEINKSIESYNLAILAKSDYADAWYNKGIALMNQTRYDEAIQSFDKAIEYYKNTKGNDLNLARSWYNRGIAFMNMTKYNEAIQSFDKAIEYYKNIKEIDPSLALAWYNKGLAFDALDKTTEANAAFTKANVLGYRC